MTTITSTSSPPKRQSFSLGPRPLHLALSISTPGSSAASATIYTSPSPHSESPNSIPSSARIARNGGKPRRQSSISYFSPKDSEARNSTVGSESRARHGLTRSMSVGIKPPLSPGIAGDRRSTGSAGSSTERQPHTLAERHADLLHFIAQKESKCLELRTQLAVHETELLQLKRKWERIVNRGFERSNGINEYALSSSSPMSNNAQLQGGAMLDGIREGVQGVSRLIAAGLGEFSSVSSPSPIPSPRSGAPRQSHSAQTSSSSVSTYATSASKSTRLSQSSASSLGDDFTELPSHDEVNKAEIEQEPEAGDAGATSTTRPDPNLDSGHSELHSNVGEIKISPMASERPTTKIHRRTSTPLSPSAFASKSFDLSTTPTIDPPSVKRTLKAKRMSGTGLPPHVHVAPIPVLGSLTGVDGDVGAQPVTSWVGSVGKKWEEIQRGPTFKKNQKRASVLFSDMSQSITSALSSPPIISASYYPTHSITSTSGSRATSQSSTPLQSVSSLLDEDDATTHGGLGAVMQPDSHVSVQSAPQMNASASVKDGGGFGDDEEWGW